VASLYECALAGFMHKLLALVQIFLMKISGISENRSLFSCSDLFCFSTILGLTIRSAAPDHEDCIRLKSAPKASAATFLLGL